MGREDGQDGSGIAQNCCIKSMTIRTAPVIKAAQAAMAAMASTAPGPLLAAGSGAMAAAAFGASAASGAGALASAAAGATEAGSGKAWVAALLRGLASPAFIFRPPFFASAGGGTA